MERVSLGRYIFTTDAQVFPFEIEEMAELAEEAYRENLKKLQGPDDLKELPIYFSNDGGHISQNGLVLMESFPSGKTYTEKDYFKYLVKHEMVHYLVQVHWLWNPGPCAFLNEGLAQSISEGEFIHRFYGFSYHQFVKELIVTGSYLNLRQFVSTDIFLECRDKDGRVISENSSFCGYLISHYGMEIYKAAFKKANSPISRNHYEFNLLRVLRTVYGRSLDGLEEEWIAFLDTVETVEGLDNLVNKKYSQGQPLPTLEGLRCASCGYIMMETGNCAECSYDRTIQITIIE